MLDTLKELVGAKWLAVIVVVLSAALAGLGAWVASSGDWIAVVSAVIACILGPGAWGAKQIISADKTPPTDPTATAPVTP